MAPDSREPRGLSGGEGREGAGSRRGLRAWLWRGLGLFKSALEVIVCAAVLWLFVFQVSVVSGHSMDPNLEPGDRLVIDKLSPLWRSIRRFDVIVFECPLDTGVDYVKRVVGLPGEMIELRGGELFVNGEPVAQEFDFVDDLRWHGPVKVPDGFYFVLGDNRPRSKDSLSFGPVWGKKIKGIARFRVYPFGRTGAL